MEKMELGEKAEVILDNVGKSETEKAIDDILFSHHEERLGIKEEPKKEPIDYKWEKNEFEATKKCQKCGAVMRGWAYRQEFKYCPMCGEKLA